LSRTNDGLSDTVIRDIKPKSAVARLRTDFSSAERAKSVDIELVAALVGMSRAYIGRALGGPGTRPKKLTITQVLELLELDAFQETFLPRSQIADYLISVAPLKKSSLNLTDKRVQLLGGNALDLVARIPSSTVQCVVTSSPYWGMRLYENDRDVAWADGESCPYGFEQTPEGFIRHTVELLYRLKPALTSSGSVWWNLMDTFNTRTPIRGNARERLDAMGGKGSSQLGWTEHAACRHSAGHMYLDDGEQSAIPMRVAERASRIGYGLKSFITWRKHWSTPESARSRVSRQAEYVLHLSVGGTPFFDRSAWQQLPIHLGGPSPGHESPQKITDVWSLPAAPGNNGHGAEFPLALPGRCIALTSRENDLILDPFVGSGTTALAAIELNRRCLGFDISDEYVQIARDRIEAVEQRMSSSLINPNLGSVNAAAMSAATNGHKVQKRSVRALTAK
jgi:DNA modification methylase